MSKSDIEYLRAEVARAQSEGAGSVLVRIPEMHSLLAKLAEYERRFSQLPKGRPVVAGFANVEAIEAMRAGNCFFLRVARARTSNMREPVYYDRK